MPFIRAIGRWTLTALVINCIIGGGIFGVPGELTRLLGRASPLAMVVAAIGMTVILACITEIACRFAEPGGPYLYVRTAFGQFLGMQVGWFHLLSMIGAMSALADLFLDYLPAVVPVALNRSERAVVIAVLLAIPAAVNYVGVHSGAVLNNITTVAKLLPLALLIVVGMAYMKQPAMIGASEVFSPGLSNWISAMVLLLFTYGGWESALIPSGEIAEPRRTIPFGLSVGMLGCAVIYALLQFVTVAIVGATDSERPLAAAASLLLGRNGAAFVAVAVMVSTYGWISGAMLYSPRLAYALATQGAFPSVFGKLHPRFHTPNAAILLQLLAGWTLAFTGSFLWIIALSAGSMMVYYAGTCASLMPLRRMRKSAGSFQLPFGGGFSALGVAISIGLMFGLARWQLLLMLVTALIATINWFWARYGYAKAVRKMKAASRGNV